MRWNNLLKNKCPQCNKIFKTFDMFGIDCKCGFYISQKKFKQITNDMAIRDNSQPIENSEEYNQNYLNNL